MLLKSLWEKKLWIKENNSVISHHKRKVSEYPKVEKAQILRDKILENNKIKLQQGFQMNIVTVTFILINQVKKKAKLMKL